MFFFSSNAAQHVLLRSEIPPLEIESNSILFYFSLFFFVVYSFSFFFTRITTAFYSKLVANYNEYHLRKWNIQNDSNEGKWYICIIYMRCVDSTHNIHLYHHFLFCINSPHPLCQAIQLTRHTFVGGEVEGWTDWQWMGGDNEYSNRKDINIGTTDI